MITSAIIPQDYKCVLMRDNIEKNLRTCQKITSPVYPLPTQKYLLHKVGFSNYLPFLAISLLEMKIGSFAKNWLLLTSFSLVFSLSVSRLFAFLLLAFGRTEN